jgi:hypothetical protein
VSEIESLGLQRLAITVAMGFSVVPFLSLPLLRIMVVVVVVVAAIQE